MATWAEIRRVTTYFMLSKQPKWPNMAKNDYKRPKIVKTALMAMNGQNNQKIQTKTAKNDQKNNKKY